MTAPRRPTIGVFDSGVGGLTVLRALLERIHGADYLYLVIACNTATALALDEIKAASRVEVIGVIEPGAEAAASASHKKKVVVIGTDATIGSHAYHRALEHKGIAAREKACPLFVPLVEEGWTDHTVTEQVAGIYLTEAFSGGSQGADVLLLGCTHYPLIRPLLRRVVPTHVTIVDSAESTALAVATQLRISPPSAREESEKGFQPSLQFFATDSAEKFKKMGTRFLGHPVENVLHVDLNE